MVRGHCNNKQGRLAETEIISFLMIQVYNNRSGVVVTMNKQQLEHIIRAACSITGEDNIVIIGSQAILASFPNTVLPDMLTQSIEADVFYLSENSQELTNLIDGTIGELSMFQDTHGIYAHGVGRETAVLPAGWEDRLVRLSNSNTSGYTGICLDPYDLCVSKLIACREKDISYVKALLGAGLLDVDELRKRLDVVEGFAEQKDIASAIMQACLATSPPPD